MPESTRPRAQPSAPKFKSIRETRRPGKLYRLFQLFVFYTAYLAVWKCPINKPLGCSCVPCKTLHWTVNEHLVPLWHTYGEPTYNANIKPYAEPLVAAAAPVTHSVYQSTVEPVAEYIRYIYAEYVVKDISITKKIIYAYYRRYLGAYHDRLEAAVRGPLATLQPHFATAKEHAHEYALAALEWTQKHLFPYVRYYVHIIWESVRSLTAVAVTQFKEFALTGVVDAQNWAQKKYKEFNTEPYIETGTSFSTETVQEPTSVVSATVSSTMPSTIDSTILPETPSILPTVAAGEDPKDASDFLQWKSAAGSAPVSILPVDVPNTNKVDWFKRINRTATAAIKNLEDDSKVFQEKLIADAKPEIMEILRGLSRYGEESVKKLTDFVSKVENEEMEIENEANAYGKFDKVAQHLQDKMYAVRNKCSELAQEAIDKTSEYRKDSVDSLDDFFDVVLLEAGKEAAEVEDGEDEWAKWQSYSKLKKLLVKTRNDVDSHVIDMETLNVALRESQQAAVLLTQEFTNHLRALRSKLQFHIQQNAAEQIKKQRENGEDAPVDAIVYEIVEDEDDAEGDEEIETETRFITSVIYSTVQNTKVHSSETESAEAAETETAEA